MEGLGGKCQPEKKSHRDQYVGGHIEKPKKEKYVRTLAGEKRVCPGVTELAGGEKKGMGVAAGRKKTKQLAT